MSDLLKRIYVMLDEVMASELNTLNIYARLAEAYEELDNEKSADVAGLYKPNFFVFMNYIKAHESELNSIKFAIESRIAEKHKRDSEITMRRWKENIGKIPQKDEFTLEGIETWYISHFEMLPNYGSIHNPLFREEARKLVASGFNLAFNCSNGTGSIIASDCGFTIDLWQYMKKTTICKSTLDEVIDWIIHFYDQKKEKDKDVSHEAHIQP